MKSSVKQNIIYSCIIAAIFTGSLIVWNIMGSAKVENPVAEIYKNGVLVQTVTDLHSHVRPTFTIGTPETGINIVRVKNGKIWVSEADCHNQICASVFITEGIIPIICLPNRLEIRIVGGDDGGVDAVAR